MLLWLPVVHGAKEAILACGYVASKLPLSRAAAFYPSSANPKPIEINTTTPPDLRELWRTAQIPRLASVSWTFLLFH